MIYLGILVWVACGVYAAGIMINDLVWRYLGICWSSRTSDKFVAFMIVTLGPIGLLAALFASMTWEPRFRFPTYEEYVAEHNRCFSPLEPDPR